MIVDVANSTSVAGVAYASPAGLDSNNGDLSTPKKTIGGCEGFARVFLLTLIRWLCQGHVPRHRRRRRPDPATPVT